MSVRAMRRAWVVFLLTMAIALVGGYWAVRYAVRFPQRPAAVPGSSAELAVARGATLPAVARQLEELGIVRSALAFRLYATYRGAASRLRAGTYRLSSAMTPAEILERLIRGVPDPTVSVTIPEGSNLLDVARILAAAGIVPSQELLQQARDLRLLRRIGFPGDTVEGFLFPDTYRLRANSPPEAVLSALFRQHVQVFVALRRQYARRTQWLRRNLGWGHYEIVTMASLVEKETAKAEERPLIAGVFFNRLLFPSFTPKLLQTDPTIIYGCTVPVRRSAACQSFNGRIRRVHLDDRDNPYNTYKHPGLPPGPIANPGRAALKAVFEPTKSSFLYFVSRNDGTHHFSATRSEHQQAVAKYQLRGERASP